MINFFNKLIKLIDCFNGIIFGDFIKEFYLNDNNFYQKNYKNNSLNNNINNVNNINIILDNDTIIMYFIRFLIKIFNIERNTIINNYIYNYYSYDVFIENKVIKINIMSKNINEKYLNNNILKLTNTIDYNYVFYKNNSLGVLDNLIKNKKILNILLNRINNKIFSISYKEIYINKHLKNINNSYNLVKKGYHMDDYILTKKIKYCKKYNKNISSIIFFKWKNKEFIKSNKFRKLYNKKDYDKLFSQDECVICGNKFKNEDIVINTNCNHNFHWKSDNNIECKGLENWITNHKHNCPICRFENFI
jgi:hypothetical protein